MPVPFLHVSGPVYTVCILCALYVLGRLGGRGSFVLQNVSACFGTGECLVFCIAVFRSTGYVSEIVAMPMLQFRVGLKESILHIPWPSCV